VSCGHWLCERRVRTLARRLGLPVIAARRCLSVVVLADGRQLEVDFRRSPPTVVGPSRDPRHYVLAGVDSLPLAPAIVHEGENLWGTGWTREQVDAADFGAKLAGGDQ